MKKPIAKALRILSGQRGETLVEGVVSLVVFTLLILTVSAMLMTSLRITTAATLDAAARQSEANQAALGDFTTGNWAEVNPGVSKSVTLADSASGISISVPIDLYRGEYYTVFVPVP